ncbi:MAG TPA: beta-xylosidase [Verrucomicrobiae bacterium]|nr:beta-xylosidase [Verrucomicrobiae bacterium]
MKFPFACGGLLLLATAAFAETNSLPVTFHIHADKPVGELTPIWRFFGYDEANYTYMKDGKKLLSELGALEGPQIFIRCHHLLTSGDGAYSLKFGSTSAYKEDAKGNPVYDWSINDKIFDTYLKRGLKPYVEIGFMPEALSSHPQNYPHHPPVDEMAPVNCGQSYPPKDYAKWDELVYQWTKHCVKKYGAKEVASWYWEVWNEPNISYWHGSHADYFKLYDYAADGVRRALPNAKVGGPETAGGPGGKFLGEFLEHCARGTNYVSGKIGSPLDFISFHAKGSPKFVNGHVEMGMANQFADMKNAFAVIATFPEFKKLPVIIGESDPEGCAACKSPQDGYRNGTMYSSYTAASFPREYELAEKYGINLQGALTWAFEFEDQPPFAGFRQLASDGIDLPVLNVFRMFSKMSGERVAVEGGTGYDAEKILKSGVRKNPDIDALAAFDKEKSRLTVLAWHYDDDDLPGPDAEVDLVLDHLPLENGRATVTEYRIDADHSNSYEAWKRMGAPQQLTGQQYAALEKSGQLAEGKPEKIQIKDGVAFIQSVKLPRQGVLLFVIEGLKH